MTRVSHIHRRTIALLSAFLMLVGIVAAPAAQARPAGHRSGPGTTTVTTAPGIATTLLGAGIAPLPVAPARLGLGLGGGLAVSYAFPITGSTADLAAGTGDITHAGGINFVSLFKKLEIGKFDIDLAAGTIFAAEVNYQPARLAALDLDLSKARVRTSHGVTVVSGITVRLDPAAATALNQTFGTALPVDGSLVFGSASVRIGG